MDAYLLFNFALVVLGSMLIGWCLRVLYTILSSHSVDTRVSSVGTISPTFVINGQHTSGYLKYFNHMRGRKVRVTITLLD